ncbi:hypothetical protein [Epilithonimonas mollis]|uniref:DUF5723 domain-containing protein n=1 Tax=Epilithonimonas mollis TaxID=216903 RepID=A0A1M6U0W1_9FLAO|nr:hypothetical protein [Epilithonimonas mollis]SHK62885.1 hypothetical protein SAMN05444371_3058 [Epilithonimonas mollis]
MLKLFLIEFLIICNITITAQNNFSFSNDVYSGINSAVLSPAEPFLNPNPWDINLFSPDVFLQNDYAYISQSSIMGLRNATIETANPKKGITGENQTNVFDFYKKDKVNFLFSSDIMGPSFSIITNFREKKYVFGIFTRLRSQASVLDLDNYFKYGNQMISQPDYYEMKPFSSIIMNWNEIGLNAATTIFHYSNKQWVIGLNLKYEMGLDAAHIISQQNITLTATEPDLGTNPDKKNIYASDYNVSVNYITNYNSEKKSYDYKQNGMGLGADLGLTMVDKNPGENEYESRFSFNILDLGFVNFKQGLNHNFVNGNKIWLQNNPDFENLEIEGPEQYLKLLSKEAYADEKRSFTSNGFKIGLPTSLYFNYSRRIKENHFINFNWIQRIPVLENSLKRNNSMNINYSVQKAVIGYGISTNLSEYRNIQFGGYFRIGPLILGSENAFPLLFKQKKLHAAHFYLAIKLYPFWDNEMKRHRRKKCDCEK